MFGFRLVSLEWVYVFMGENQWRMAGEGQREKKVSEEVRGDGVRAWTWVGSSSTRAGGKENNTGVDAAC